MTNELANIFIDYYTNIVEYTAGTPPSTIADTLPPGTNSDEIIKQICDKYKNHPSIKCIKNNKSYNNTFSFRLVTEK